MEFSPRLYHWFVRPKWVTKKYIHNHLTQSFDFDNKMVLDFGSGTGANCSMLEPSRYLGIDPDGRRIHYAKRIYPQHRFSVFENSRIPMHDESVDCILIIAVLHHICSEDIALYMEEFRRVLKPGGTIVAIEPCLCEKNPICNTFMQLYDKGEYIRDELSYLQLFQDHNYECEVLKRFKKCFLYNELFFSAVPK
jgi:ubiquinone/menaquinone biosynthesis C-methylase UbiE